MVVLLQALHCKRLITAIILLISMLMLWYYSFSFLLFSSSFHIISSSSDKIYKKKTCKTNIPPNTSVRGPGWTQAIFIIEHITEHVSSYLQISPDLIRVCNFKLFFKNHYYIKTMNFYTKGQITPCGQKLIYFTPSIMWEQLKKSADYEKRQKLVQIFNQSNRWTKRGLFFSFFFFFFFKKKYFN